MRSPGYPGKRRINYTGDIVTRIELGQVTGPDTTGIFWRTSHAAYEKDTDKTIVTYDPIPPAQTKELLGAWESRQLRKIGPLF